MQDRCRRERDEQNTAVFRLLDTLTNHKSHIQTRLARLKETAGRTHALAVAEGND